MELEQFSKEKENEVSTRVLETVEPRCEYFTACESTSRRSESWACKGHVTDDDRLMMCACFNRFLNPEQRPEDMSGRDCIRVFQRKVKANLSMGEKLRDKTRTRHQ